MNIFTGIFMNFNREFQNNFFSEQVSVTIYYICVILQVGLIIKTIEFSKISLGNCTQIKSIWFE